MMKLISCYIENFGCLSHYTLQFQSGITVIKEDNGFGKSTLAAFIRAMFYGFSRSGKALERNDRKRYTPWQGGTFGGNLVFEFEHVHYRVERTFGTAPKFDTFALYTLNPLQRSTRFTQQIGLELFQLDADSFERSCYMHQLHGLTTLSTNSIQAKLNNLVEDADDLISYDKAISALRAKRSTLLPYRGSGGAISLAQEQISRLQTELSQLQISRLTTLEAQLADTNALLSEKRRQLNEVRHEITRASELAGTEFLLQQEAELSASIEQTQQAIRPLQAQHPAGFPSESCFRSLFTAAQQLQTLQSALSPVANAPSGETVAACTQLYSQLQHLQLRRDNAVLSDSETEELHALQNFFQNDIPSDETLSQWERSLAFPPASVSSRFSRVLLFLSLGITLVGCTLFLLQYIQPGIILALAGLVLTGGILLFRLFSSRPLPRLSSRTTSPGKRQRGHPSDAAIREFLSKYYHPLPPLYDALTDLRRKKQALSALQDKAQQCALQRQNLEQEMQSLKESLFQQLQPFASPDASLEDALFQLRQQQVHHEQQTLQQKQHAAQRMELENILHSARHYFPVGTPIDDKAISDLHDDMQRCQSLELQLRFYTQQLADLRAQHPSLTVESGESPEALKAQEKALSSEIDVLSNRLLQERQQLHLLQQELDQLAEKEDALEHWKLQKAQDLKTVVLLDKTIAFLESARSALSRTHLQVIQERFKAYLGKLAPFEPEDAFVGADLTVSLERSGEARPIGCFSTGSTDLVMLCMRLALVDTLFRDTTPLLILDDPFVNLDDKHTKAALKLLHDISADHQILYLVCHSSRC